MLDVAITALKAVLVSEGLLTDRAESADVAPQPEVAPAYAAKEL
jgi:hypothetical protein